MPAPGSSWPPATPLQETDNTSTGSESGIGIHAQQGGWLHLYNSIVWGSRDAGTVRDGLQLGGSTGKNVEFSVSRAP